QFRPAPNTDLNEVQAKVWQRAKTEQVRFDFVRERRRISADFRIPNLGRCGFESRFINVTDAGDLETRIRMKRRRVMNASFPHSNTNNCLGIHCALPHSTHLETT